MSSQQFCRDIDAVLPAVSLFIACLTFVIALIVALPIAIAFFSAVAGIVAFGLSLIAFAWIIGSLLKIGSCALASAANVYGHKATQYASQRVRQRTYAHATRSHAMPSDEDDTIILGPTQRKRAQSNPRNSKPLRYTKPPRPASKRLEKQYILTAGVR